MGSQLTGVAGVNDLFAIDANPAIPLAGAIALCRGRTDRQI